MKTSFSFIKTILGSMLLISACSFSLNAQAPPLQWEKRYGDTGTDGLNAISQTNDGGYITAGIFRQNSPTIHQDFWIQKIDAVGNVTWAKTYGGITQDRAATVIQTNDGYIVGGETNSSNGDVTGNHGMTDAWILKLDNSGNIIWKRCYGGSTWDRCSKILSLPDNTLMVLGLTSCDDGDLTGVNTVGFFGESNIWLMKLDSAGNILWQKTYGGLSHDDGYNIINMPDGGFTMSGTEATQMGMYDMWVCRIDAAGTIIWEKTFGHSDYDYAYTLTLTEENDLLVAGYTMSTDFPGFNGGPCDAVLAKLNGENGDLIWEKVLGGTGAEWIKGITTYNGLYVMAGTSNSTDGDISSPLGSWDVWLVAVNDSGNVQWDKSYGGSEEDGSSPFNIDIITTADNGLAVAGMIGSPELSGGGGLWDGYVFKLKTNSTGIPNNNVFTNITLFPNPVKDMLTIQTNHTENYVYSIVDMQGRLLQSGSFNQSLKNVDIANLPTGVYLLQLSNEKGQSIARKILKE